MMRMALLTSLISNFNIQGDTKHAAPPSLLLADVPNVTVHPSAAVVAITVLLYNGPLLCDLKGLRWRVTPLNVRKILRLAVRKRKRRVWCVSACVRAFQTTVGVWVAAAVTAAPYPFFTRTYFYLSDPRDGSPLHDSLICTVPVKWLADARVLLQLSTFMLFVFPMTLITVLYVLIGLAVQRSVQAPALAAHNGGTACRGQSSTTRSSVLSRSASTISQSRKNVIEMLGQYMSVTN